MKLLIFVLIVFVANIVSVSSADPFTCLECANCPLKADAKPSKAECLKCKTTTDKTAGTVKRECSKLVADCAPGPTGSTIVECCDGNNCNSQEPLNPVIPSSKKFSCYQCAGCANPFQKDVSLQKSGCEACKTTTTKADKKIEKACIETAADCKPITNDEKTLVECCTTDLCNAGISHSIKKSVLVGLLSLAIGAICY